MAGHTAEEAEIRHLAAEAAAAHSTNPWGPLGRKLGEHAGRVSSRAIGIQDSTVIDRAIGSPGMLKPHKVHGFVVMDGRHGAEDRKPAEVDDVIRKLTQQIRIAPNISTAVVFAHTRDFFPSHVLSCDAQVGALLASAYPNAQQTLDLRKEAPDPSSTVPSGPWRVSPSSLTVADNGGIVAALDDPERDARYMAPGDAVVVVNPEDVEAVLGVGRLHHVRPGDGSELLLVFDRFKHTETYQGSGPSAPAGTTEVG
jgi:hypothetical protein